MTLLKKILEDMYILSYWFVDFHLLCDEFFLYIGLSDYITSKYVFSRANHTSLIILYALTWVIMSLAKYVFSRANHALLATLYAPTWEKIEFSTESQNAAKAKWSFLFQVRILVWWVVSDVVLTSTS